MQYVTRTRAAQAIALAAVAALAITVYVLAAPASAGAVDDAPCSGKATRAGTQVTYCPLWMPSRGYIPVHQFTSSGEPVERGKLVQAGKVNWFVCESRHPDGYTPPAYFDGGYPYRNGWWAKTLSDDGVWGWVNEIYFKGGDNEEPDPGLRSCDGGSNDAPTTPASAESKAGCEELIEDQRLTVRVSAHERFQNSWFNQSTGSIVNGKPFDEADFNAGKIELSAATCSNKNGDWRIVLPVWAASQYHGLKLGEGLTGDRAVGAIVKGYRHSSSSSDPYEKASLDVEIFDCAKSNQWSVFNAIATFPLPGVRYAVSVGQFAYSLWAPEDKPACQTLGTMRLRLGVLEHVATGCRKQARKRPTSRRPLCRAIKRYAPAKRWKKAKKRWTKRNWSSRPGALLVRSSDTTFKEKWTQTPGAGATPLTTTHTMRVRIEP